MAKLALLLVFSVVAVSGVFVYKGHPRLKEGHPDWSRISKDLAEMQQTSDAVNIGGVIGNASLTQINAKGDRMFWWFVNKLGSSPNADSSPVIMWLQGGPGCSSMTGNLFEFGPLLYNSSGLSNRTGSWATQYHLLFVDNPIGAGYSVPGPNSSYVTNQYQMATNLYALLQNISHIHPEYFNGHDFYIFGESYAGKYVPSIAYYILNWNGNATQLGNAIIPLKGIGIGDGISDPAIQLTSYSDYGMATGLIDEYESDMVQVFESQTAQFMNQKQWVKAVRMSNNAVNEVVKAGGNVNVYNVRYFGDYNTSALDTWLNSSATKMLLHVPNGITYLDCGAPAYDALEADVALSVTNLFSYLLNNTRVLLYEGQDDLILNSVGSETWISKLQWYGQSKYLAAPRSIWTANGAVAGYARNYANLTQLIVLKAGHMVPYDQLANSLDMVTRFINNSTWGPAV